MVTDLQKAFIAAAVIGTASVIIFLGLGLFWEVVEHYRRERILKLHRRLEK